MSAYHECLRSGEPAHHLPRSPPDEQTFASTSRHNNRNTVSNLHNALKTQRRLRYKHTTWVHGHHQPHPCHSEAALNNVDDQSDSTLSTFCWRFPDSCNVTCTSVVFRFSLLASGRQRSSTECCLQVRLVGKWRTAQQRRVSPRSENAGARITLVAITISVRGAERRWVACEDGHETKRVIQNAHSEFLYLFVLPQHLF